MKKLLILCLTAAIAVVGCRDLGEELGRKTEIHGRVVNLITGEGIPNREIRARMSTGSLVTPGSPVVELGRVFTASDGTFELSFKGGGNGDGHICEILGTYDDTLKFFQSSVENTQAAITLHEDNEIEFRVVPQAYLYFSLKNVNYQNENDEIAYRMANYQLNWGTAPGDTNIFRGMMDASSGSIPVPMGWLVFTWDVTRNGQTARFRDSIWCKSGSSNYFTINY